MASIKNPAQRRGFFVSRPARLRRAAFACGYNVSWGDVSRAIVLPRYCAEVERCHTIRVEQASPSMPMDEKPSKNANEYFAKQNLEIIHEMRLKLDAERRKAERLSLIH